MKKENRLLTRGGVPKDPVSGRHAQEKEVRVILTLSPFVRPGSLHANVECYANQAFFFIATDFDPELMPKELRFESGGLQNSRQEPMINPVEGLGLI